MGNNRPPQRRKHDTFASPSSPLLSTRPFAPTTSHPSSSLLSQDQPASPLPARGFRYSFEHMAVHRPDPKALAGNEAEGVASGEITNSSPRQFTSDGESLAEQEQPIPTAQEKASLALSSVSALQRMKVPASQPVALPPPTNRQTGTNRSGWSIERMAITYNPLPSAQRRVTDAPTTQKSSPQAEVLQQQSAESATPRENTTGLPDHLKAGVENLSGLSLDDVHVHYNSSKPAQVDALAYTQGTEIHVGPGQERHLAHEAWHVVQQMRGRVRPTLQMKGVAINDDQGLEREADVMGAKAVAGKSVEGLLNQFVGASDKTQTGSSSSGSENPYPLQTMQAVVQRAIGHQVDLQTEPFYTDIFNFRGEAPTHDGRNVAVFYLDGGPPVVMDSAFGQHSEQRIHAALTPQERAQVNWIHSEYQPCPETCEPLIRNNYPHLGDDNVSYWWDYSPTGRVKGRKHKKIDLGWGKEHRLSQNLKRRSANRRNILGALLGIFRRG